MRKDAKNGNLGRMRSVILSFALVLPMAGCASAKSTATTIVAATDLAADSFADSYKAATEAQVGHCEQQIELGKIGDTKADKVECMGAFSSENHDKAIAAVEVLITAQMAVKSAAECEELATCVENPNWKALADQVKSAWAAIKPFVQTVKGNSK